LQALSLRSLYLGCLRLLAGLVFAIALPILPAAAQPTASSDHATGTLLFERSAAMPGDSFVGALKLDLAEGWHVYWINGGDSGLPPSATWANSPTVTTGEFRFPPPHAIPLDPLMSYAYEKQLVLLFDVTVAADANVGDTLTIGGVFDYLICADVCIPETITLSTSIPVAASPASDGAAGEVIAGALARIPAKLSGRATIERVDRIFHLGVADPAVAAAMANAADVRFFPVGPQILHFPAQAAKFGPEGVALELQASDFATPTSVIEGLLVVEGKDGSYKGWEVSPAKGPLPEGIADGEFIRAKADPVPASAPAAAPLDLAGIATLLGLAFLGGLVLNLMPCVLPVLTIKAAGLVHTAHNPAESRRHGLAYLAGVVVCFAAVGVILVALKAAGDTAIGLGFQLQYSWVTAFFALVMFAVGLNLLGVFEIGGSLAGVGGNVADKGGTSGAFFTGLLAGFVGAPCVGPFMAPAVGVAMVQSAPIIIAVFVVIGLGMAAPLVLLSFTPAFAKILPKPGRWMETFRQVLAFPMFLTALWLLWVLSAQAGTDGVLAVLAGSIVLAFGIWLAGKAGQGLGGRIVAAAVVIGGFATAPVLMNLPKEQLLVEGSPWSPQQVSALRSEGRVIMVDFTATWCITCQVNKSTTLTSASVQKAFADTNTAFLIADWTNKDKVIGEELASHGAAGIPFYLIYPASGGEPLKFDGLLSPGQIEQAIREAAGSI
jgi:DsbC/DsbD-like thiol-disulfide interchange protein/cytochrome c biogenesis protein CcdA